MQNIKSFFGLSILITFLTIQSLFSQNLNPGIDEIYRPDELAEIHLTLDEAEKAFFSDPINQNSDAYKSADFRMVNSQFDTVLSIKVGIRLRGNTSRQHEKKGFKIDFSEFGGEKFFGYKKFNLKPNVNDPSLVRELLTLKIYNEMGVPAARTHFTKLFMNGEYMGVYLNIEQIDDEFLDLRYGHEDGFLYKCAWGSNLSNSNQATDANLLESEINEELDTRAEIKNFIQVLNGTSTSQFGEEFSKVFNIDTYLRQLAVEALLGHWDAYSYNQNNFYLFYNGETGRVEFIPYDTDNTWGIDWIDRDWATRDLKSWTKTNDPRPLTTKILTVEAYKNNYYYYLGVLMDNYFNEDYLLPLFSKYKNLLVEAIETDTFYGRAFGYTYADFLNSFETKANVNHVDYGLREYLTLRRSKAIEQVVFSDKILSTGKGALNDTRLFPNPSKGECFYIHSNTAINNQIKVYHVSGIQMPVKVNFEGGGNYKISFSQKLDTGLYLIEIGTETLKWIYEK